MILNKVLRMYPPPAQVRRRNFGVKMQKIQSREVLWRATQGKEAITPSFLSAGDQEYAEGRSSPLTEAKMALSMILQCFSLELSAFYVHAPMRLSFLQPHMVLRSFYQALDKKECRQAIWLICCLWKWILLRRASLGGGVLPKWI